jgi:glycosyltransferase involved in cell wall biosynthesis
MRILVVFRYYVPDTPAYAEILRIILAHLHDSGHDITVFTGQPAYKADLANPRQPWQERLDGIAVRRTRLLSERGPLARLRAVNSVLFPLKAAAHALWSRLTGEPYDLVWTVSTPPVIQGAILSLAARLTGSRYLYHVEDLHPELALLSGFLSDGLVYRFLQRLDTAALRRADAVVVLSADMRDALLERGEALKQIAIINNPCLVERPAEPGVLPPDQPDKPFELIFAGNLGRFQALDSLLEAACLLEAAGEKIRLVFMGSGVMKPALLRQAEASGTRSVVFLDHRPLDQAIPLMQDADMGVVSVQPAVCRVAYPSKTMTYLAIGLPVLAIVEPQSELARMIEGENLGVVVPRPQPEEIAATIRAAIGRREEFRARRRDIARIAERHFSPVAICQQWVELLARLENPAHSRLTASRAASPSS